MNRTPKARDPLEAELESLRPAALPAELVARIASELEEPRRSPRFRLWWIPAAAAVAACVAIAAAVWRAKTPGVSPLRTVVHTMPVVPPDTGVGEDLPALATYHRALAGPPAALDELLDRHAARSLSGGSRSRAGAGFFGTQDFNR